MDSKYAVGASKADDGGSGSIDAVKIIGSFFTDDASRARRDRQLAP